MRELRKNYFLTYYSTTIMDKSKLIIYILIGLIITGSIVLLVMMLMV